MLYFTGETNGADTNREQAPVQVQGVVLYLLYYICVYLIFMCSHQGTRENKDRSEIRNFSLGFFYLNR